MTAIENARVLDLFAGSAALGLEAISRGASSLTLVEQSRQAFEVCKKNKELFETALSHQQVTKEIQLKNTDAHSYLKSSKGIFDLVFIDPPYDFADDKIASLLVELRPVLSTEAVVVLERGKQATAAYQGFEVVNQKGFGDTSVFFLRPLSQ
jgi:16S rRNA (guanine966-N2)-methyltransferase